MLINSLKVLSSSSEEQIKYLENLFGNKYFNIDEILLEYDDAKFLQSNYDENFSEMFSELDLLLNEIDEKGLHEANDLNNEIWKKVRIRAKAILKLIDN
jgi:hypothetical protein